MEYIPDAWFSMLTREFLTPSDRLALFRTSRRFRAIVLHSTPGLVHTRMEPTGINAMTRLASLLSKPCVSLHLTGRMGAVPKELCPYVVDLSMNHPHTIESANLSDMTNLYRLEIRRSSWDEYPQKILRAVNALTKRMEHAPQLRHLRLCDPWVLSTLVLGTPGDDDDMIPLLCFWFGWWCLSRATFPQSFR